MLVAVALAMLVSLTAAPRRDGNGQPGTTGSAGPTFVQIELGEDDPPREPKHQESPAKKPRLKALLVQTTPPVDPAQPLAFGLLAGDVAPTLELDPATPHAEPGTGARREDPVLRLHPGQAPPRRVV